MLNKRSEQNTLNESILQHFILLGVFIFEALVKALNLLIPKPKKKESLEILKRKEKLAAKTNQELKAILKDVDLLSSFTSDQLKDIFLTNDEAMNKLHVSERKAALLKMRNEELRSLLIGEDKVSRLKKSELVDLILLKEFTVKL